MINKLKKVNPRIAIIVLHIIALAFLALFALGLSFDLYREGGGGFAVAWAVVLYSLTKIVFGYQASNNKGVSDNSPAN